MWSRFREAVLFLVPLVLCVLLSVQCSEDPSAPAQEVPPLTSVSKVIDQNGGEVALGNEAKVIIPSGALDSALTITITKIFAPPNLPANYILRGIGYSFTPHHYSFNDSVTISVAYNQQVSDPSFAKLDDDLDAFWEFIPNATYFNEIATYKSLTFSILAVADFFALEQVYVSRSSKGMNAAGTSDDPLPTINAGIEVSLAAGEPHPPVYAAIGAYEEEITFVGGVSIHGGFNEETWEKPEGAYH